MTKTYSYNYDEYEAGRGAATMVEDILADPEFPQVTEVAIGNWGSA